MQSQVDQNKIKKGDRFLTTINGNRVRTVAEVRHEQQEMTVGWGSVHYQMTYVQFEDEDNWYPWGYLRPILP